MVAAVAGLPVMAVYCKVQLLRQSAFLIVLDKQDIAMPNVRARVLSEMEDQVEPRCMVKVGKPQGFQ